MGEAKVFERFRENLGQDIDSLQFVLKSANDLNKPQSMIEPQVIEESEERRVLEGATTGAMIGSQFGPFGSLVGGIAGLWK